MAAMNYLLRPATLAEKPALRELIELSARGLSAPDYRPEQVEVHCAAPSAWTPR